MTVVVFDGTTLAADKLSLNDYYPRAVRKIERINGCLCAFAGEASLGAQMMDWFRKGAKPDEFPSQQRDGTDWQPFIAILPGGIVTRYERSPYPITFEDRTYAMGSGRDFALMALHLGKTAKEAVLLTQEITYSCGMGVDTLEFE